MVQVVGEQQIADDLAPLFLSQQLFHLGFAGQTDLLAPLLGFDIGQGLAAQQVADAILECRGRIETERLLDAARQARADGLLTTAQWQRVQKGLRP